MGAEHEAIPAHPKDREIFRKIDAVLSEETLILEGLSQAVKAGDISEDDKSIWLSEYIDRRNQKPSLPEMP